MGAGRLRPSGPNGGPLRHLLAPRSPDEVAAARTLAAVGLMVDGPAGLSPAPGLAELLADRMLPLNIEGTESSLRQLATMVTTSPAQPAEPVDPAPPAGPAREWERQDDATLLAQRRLSRVAGTLLATVAVAALPGLAERFAAGGDFLDVGVGVGEVAAAFCQARPAAHAVGIDLFARPLDLARRLVADRRLDGRLELRLQAVEELGDVERFDLAWLPTPFIPAAAVPPGVANVRAALRPGGWLMVGATRLDGDPLARAVNRWRTIRAGGTPLTADEVSGLLEGAGFGGFMAFPVPPSAPMSLHAARRPLG